MVSHGLAADQNLSADGRANGDNISLPLRTASGPVLNALMLTTSL